MGRFKVGIPSNNKIIKIQRDSTALLILRKQDPPSHAVKPLILLNNKRRHVGMHALTRFAKQESGRE
jgi:hypothetical protein